MSKKLITKEFIEKAIKVHGNKYDYSKVDYKNNHTKINIICPIIDHGEFYQVPSSHLNRSGCPKCGLIINKLSSIKSKNEFIEEANKIHNNKYDYSEIEYKNTNTKINIICPIKNHGIFLQNVKNHIYMKQGCPKCAGVKKLSNKYIDEFLLKNNVPIKRIGNYINKNTKIEWLCIKTNNLFISKPYNILYRDSFGCTHCSINQKLTNIDIDKYLSINNKIKRIDNYINYNTEITFYCFNCNKEFLTTPNMILHDYGCKLCVKNKKLYNYDIDKFILDNNFNIKRIDNYINDSFKINWECLKCNNIWLSSPNTIKQNHLCPNCAKGKSKNEKLIYDLLQKLNIHFNQQYNIQLPNNKKNYFSRVDFYIQSFNLFIEINGNQHYEITKIFNTNLTDKQAEENFKKQQIRDNNLRDYCNKENIHLIEIDIRRYSGKKLIKYLEIVLIGFQTINNFTYYDANF